MIQSWLSEHQFSLIFLSITTNTRSDPAFYAYGVNSWHVVVNCNLITRVYFTLCNSKGIFYPFSGGGNCFHNIGTPFAIAVQCTCALFLIIRPATLHFLVWCKKTPVLSIFQVFGAATSYPIHNVNIELEKTLNGRQRNSIGFILRC